MRDGEKRIPFDGALKVGARVDAARPSATA